MSILKSSCFLILLTIATAFGQQQETAQKITLEEAINCAVSSNLSLSSVRFALESSQITLQSRLDYFKFDLVPQISSTVNADERTDKLAVRASKRTPIGTEMTLSAASSRIEPEAGADTYKSALTLELEQPLLRNLGTRINMEPAVKARRNVLDRMREVAIRQTDLIVETAEAYESLLILQKQIEYQTKTIDRLERFLKLTGAREKQGRSTRVDTMRADLRLGSAKLRMAALLDNLLNEQTSFSELLGLDPSTRLEAVPAQLLTLDVPDPDKAVSIALSNRLDYAQILNDLADAERGIRIARQNMLPDVSIIARYELSAEAETLSETGRMDDDIWFVGLKMSSDLPLRSQKASLAEAKLAFNYSELKIETLRLAVSRQVRQSISAYRRILTEKELVEKNYRLAENRTRLARRLFEMGKGDSFSVSEAEDELLSAEQQLLTSQSQASIAVYKIKRVMGTLIDYPEELKTGAFNK